MLYFDDRSAKIASSTVICTNGSKPLYMRSYTLFRTIFAYAHLPIRPTVQLGYNTSYARPAVARTNHTVFGALTVVCCGGAAVKTLFF